MKNVCKSGPHCGWTDKGQYRCYCNNPKKDKITRIKEIVESYKARYQHSDNDSEVLNAAYNVILDIEDILEE